MSYGNSGSGDSGSSNYGNSECGPAAPINGPINIATGKGDISDSYFRNTAKQLGLNKNKVRSYSHGEGSEAYLRSHARITYGNQPRAHIVQSGKRYARRPLEEIAWYARKSASVETAKTFPQYASLQGSYRVQSTEPELFLHPARPVTEIIVNKDKIMPYVKEAFEKTTGKPFPTNLKVVVLSEKAFNEVHQGHKGAHSQFVKGFAINRNGRGINEIFVKQNHLDSLMLTIGHEIGHIMSYTLKDERDEEAKAFAFAMAWMKAIKDNNIAGIGQCINPRPAVNGVHDKAFEFVLEISEQGKSAMEIFEKLSKGELSIKNKLELVHV